MQGLMMDYPLTILPHARTRAAPVPHEGDCHQGWPQYWSARITARWPSAWGGWRTPWSAWASSPATGWRPLPSTTPATWSCISRRLAWARCCTRSTCACRPTSWPTSSSHADDQVLFVDPGLVPALEKLAPHLKTMRHYVVMGPSVPETTLSPVHSYEELLRGREPRLCLAEAGRERCRRHVLHLRHHRQPQRRGLLAPRHLPAQHGAEHGRLVRPIASATVFLPVVPMFHVLAWGTPYRRHHARA